MKATTKTLFCALALLAVQGEVRAEEPVNNGTNPTLLTTSVAAQYKHTEFLSDVSTGLFELTYSLPFGEGKRMSLAAKLPYASGVIDDDFDFGDASLTFTHVASLNQQRGIAYSAEVIFDTAERPELGTGQTVLKFSAFYAKFLQNGAIFAPAIVQQNNLSSSGSRARINNTTLDFYYVPKLANDKYFLTYDPAITSDWENSKTYLSLTVTVGRMTGKAFGGDSLIFIRPQILGGGERPVDWSMQVGYKVLGF